jgi:hypothetical protein
MTHALPDFAFAHHARFVFARLSLIAAIDQSATDGCAHDGTLSAHHLVVPAVAAFAPGCS